MQFYDILDPSLIIEAGSLILCKHLIHILLHPIKASTSYTLDFKLTSLNRLLLAVSLIDENLFSIEVHDIPKFLAGLKNPLMDRVLQIESENMHSKYLHYPLCLLIVRECIEILSSICLKVHAYSLSARLDKLCG